MEFHDNEGIKEIQEGRNDGSKKDDSRSILRRKYKLTESNVRKFLIFFFNFYISFCDRNCLPNLFPPPSGNTGRLHFSALLDVRCYHVPDL